MSNALAEDQLVELMLQLKKTTPAAARQILNAQPQIAYALIALMVKMNAIDVNVFQKILSDFALSQAQGPATAAAPPPLPPTAPVVAAVPSYPPPNQPYQHQPPAGPSHNGYNQPPYSAPPTQPAAGALPPALQDALAAFPPDQRDMLMRVVQMSPDQINALPPQDRANILQLRATLGL